MEIFFVVLFLVWVYSYWRFTGKRRAYRTMVLVTEARYRKLQTGRCAIDLACAYMNAQRYADAYSMFENVALGFPSVPRDIKLNMDFCKKPLPWSKGLKNHKMGYWHNFALARLGGRRSNLISQEAVLAFDNYNITGKLM